MEPRYIICFAGQLLDGQQLGEVRGRLAALFKADEQTLDRLFSGKTQVLKRDCDKATAARYKQAIERAGARPIIRASTAQENETSPTPRPAKPLTAAEKIAALAAAPDEGMFRPVKSESASDDTAEQATGVPQVPGEPGLAPVGADLLRPEERHEEVARKVDTAGLEVAEFEQHLAPEKPTPPAAPDTSHLGMADVGDDIPGLPAGEPPAVPATLSLDLAPMDADFTEFSRSDPEPPELDLSSVELAPPGTDVLEEQHKRREQVEPPSTDHLSLEE